MRHARALTALALAFTLLAPAVPRAQGLVPQPDINISYITNTLGGYDYFMYAVEADPATPGKEVLFYVPGLWMMSVGRWHPSKRGPYGAQAGAGLCLEPWTFITNQGPVLHFHSVGDFIGGDGLDDYVVFLTSGLIKVYRGVGLSLCK